MWFALARMSSSRSRSGTGFEQAPGQPRRGLNIAIATGLTVALVAVAGSMFTRDETWFEDYWPRGSSRPCRQSCNPATACSRRTASRTGCCSRFPSFVEGSRTTCASSSTTSVLVFDRLQDYNFEDGPNWKSFADGYRIVIVDETRMSHTKHFLEEPGARAIYRDDEITVVARRS